MSIVLWPAAAYDFNIYSVNYYRWDCPSLNRFHTIWIEEFVRLITGLMLFCFGKAIGIALGDESIGNIYHGSGDHEHDVYTTHYYKYAAVVTICATLTIDFSADIIIICARIYLLDVCIIGWFTGLRPKYVPILTETTWKVNVICLVNLFVKTCRHVLLKQESLMDFIMWWKNYESCDL